MPVDVVIPAYNEAERIDRTLRAYRSTMQTPMTRFIVALDRCTDETATVVRAHASVDNRVEVHGYPKLGKGGVLMEAFRRCDAGMVGFVDADCATPPAEFLRLVDVVARDFDRPAGSRDPNDLPRADIAIATRFHPSSVLPAKRSLARRATSLGFRALIHMLFSLSYTDTQCGAKVMRHEVIEEVLPLLSSRDFLFDVDLLVTAERLGFHVVEVPTVWVDREGSHVHPVSDSRQMVASSLRLWIHHRVLPVPGPELRAIAEGDHVETVRRLPNQHDGGQRSTPRPRPSAGTAPVRSRPAGKGNGRAVDVAIVSPYPIADPGARQSGVAAYSARLVESLTDAGVSVRVIAPSITNEGAERASAVEVTRQFSPGPLAVPRALRAAQRTGAAVVHLQHELFLYGTALSVPGLFPALARSHFTHVPTVVTMHQVVDPSEVDKTFVALHRVRAPALAARAGLSAVQRAVVSLSAATIVHERAFAEILGRAVVVPLGVDVVDTPPAADAKRRLGLRSDALVALCFGYLAPYKGLESALEAARLGGSQLQLVVAGGDHPRLSGHDPYAAELRRRYGDVARFPGYVPDEDVSTWFSASDVVLVPYPMPFASSGPFGIALGHRRPILCSPAFARCAGVPDSMVTPMDPIGLSTRLLDLAAHPEALRALSAVSAQLGAARTWNVVARAHVKLYEEVIHADRAARR